MSRVLLALGILALVHFIDAGLQLPLYQFKRNAEVESPNKGQAIWHNYRSKPFYYGLFSELNDRVKILTSVIF
jgi:hypothetical protein